MKKHKHEYIPVEWRDIVEHNQLEDVGYPNKIIGRKVTKMQCKFCSAYALEKSKGIGFYFYEEEK